MSQARRDENRVATLIGVDSVLFTTPTLVAVNPTTRAMLVEASITTGDIEIGAVEIKDGTTDTRAVVGTDGLQTHVKRYTTKIDEPDANTTYIGEAALGSATSSAVWRIKKLSVSGTVITLAWAGGVETFTQIYDNRAALSYS